MDRLLGIEPREVVLHFEVGKICTGAFILRNLMHTMPVAFKVQTAVPKKYGVKPSMGVIGPLATAVIEITYGPRSVLPEDYPFVHAQFLVKSVVVPVGAYHENVSKEWFSSKKRLVYSDTSLDIVMVGGDILRSLVATGAMDKAREVLERRSNVVDSVDELLGRTAMHIALMRRKPEMVQLLLEFSANLEIKNKEGRTALHEAVILQDNLSVELLLSKGANTEAKDPAGCTALHFAVSRSNLEIVRKLLNHNADVNAKLEDGRTALYLAAANCDKDCVRFLIDQGANPEVRGPDGSTPLHKVSLTGDLGLVKLLLSKGVEKNVINCDGKTPYHLAAESGHRNLFDLLQLGDRLRCASRKGDLKVVRQCVNQGAFINGQDQHGWSALHYAAFKGHMSIAEYLIQNQADLECRDEEGYTALHCATEAGRKDIVQLLLKHGADVNLEVKQGLTALKIAEKMKNFTGIIRLLSAQSQDQHIQDSFAAGLELSSRVFRKPKFSLMDRQCAAAVG